MYQKIRDLRTDADLSQADMAQLLHCTQQAYSNYELGLRDIPTGLLVQIAQIHQTSVDYLLDLTDVKDPYPRKRGR